MQEGPAGRGTSARHDPLSKATERARQRPAMAAERADAASAANLVGPAAERTGGRRRLGSRGGGLPRAVMARRAVPRRQDAAGPGERHPRPARHRRDAAPVTRLFDARGQMRVRSSHRDDDDLLARAARAVGVGAGVAPGTNKLVYALEAATRSVAERLGLLRPTGVAHRRSDDGPPAVAVRRSARARTSGWSGRVSSGCSPRCRSRSTDRPGTSCPCSPCRRSRRP